MALLNDADKGRIDRLHDRAVRQLVEAHRQREDEPLILAVRYRLDEPEIYLLEVLADFPGEDDDELLETEFDPSASLMILTKLRLALGSPAQVRNALQNQALAQALHDGRLEYSADTEEARTLRESLGL